MGEATETGIRWWMRYVIVPVIGGGGIIAIVVAFIGRPQNVTQNPAPQMQAVTPQAPINEATKPKNVDEDLGKSTELPKKARLDPKPELAKLSVYKALYDGTTMPLNDEDLSKKYSMSNESLGTRPTLDFTLSGSYLVWSVENPRNGLRITCSDGLLDDNYIRTKRLSVPPTGSRLVFTDRFNSCALEEKTGTDIWKELARVIIYRQAHYP